MLFKGTALGVQAGFDPATTVAMHEVTKCLSVGHLTCTKVHLNGALDTVVQSSKPGGGSAHTKGSTAAARTTRNDFMDELRQAIFFIDNSHNR